MGSAKNPEQEKAAGVVPAPEAAIEKTDRVIIVGNLRRLQSVAAKSPASPCTNCRDNFPLPEAADVFDSMVIAGYVERRTACGMCPANAKPCLDMGAQQGGGV